MLRISRIPLLPLALIIGALWIGSVDSGLSSEPLPRAEYSAVDRPRLEISLHRGRLALNGHTASFDQEYRLMRNAGRLSSIAPPQVNFKPMGTAPDYWTASSVAVLDALSSTVSANALLVEDTVRIRGVGDTGWQESARRLRRELPAVVALDVDMIIADDRVTARDVCQQAFAEYQTGAIQFEESTTRLRPSARLALDRAISLADACRASRITITGHTDASGPEAWNRELSLARADAVADYLVTGGIARSRLLTRGAGSSMPLATNATRYGRSLNRRIEIEFRQAP